MATNDTSKSPLKFDHPACLLAGALPYERRGKGDIWLEHHYLIDSELLELIIRSYLKGIDLLRQG